MTESGRIRIGNQTAFSASSLMEPFEYALANGFDAFEWFPDKKDTGEGWEEGDLSRKMRDDIRNASVAHDVKLSVHAPWQINVLRPDTRDLLYRNIQFAEEIGASIFNMHLYPDNGTAAFAEALLPIITQLVSAGIKLSIENTTMTGPDAFNGLFQALSRMDVHLLDHVGMCLDLGHANLCAATRNDYLGFMDRLDPGVPILHVHMHENYGDADSHLPLFTGPAGRDATGITGFAERMLRRGFSGCIILEQWPQPPHLLIDARNRLREIIVKAGESESPLPYREGQGEDRTAPVDDFAASIVKADRERKSWRKKLAWIEETVTDGMFELTTDRLVYLAVYLRFMARGEVSFAEDGGHYRPSHHAKMARDIHERLAGSATPENRFILRRIYPWLPSFKSSFTTAEPLTRIRDIAHRNDIPQDLKREIKTTLQNKLHRCAGPEDLVTSGDLLRRITAPGADYSPSFVEEFKRFHQELEEFFNARSLDEQLETIKEKGDTPDAVLINRFWEAKGKSDSVQALVAAMESLTELRSRFQGKLEEGSGSDAQELELADIRLEDFAFVLMSRLNNHLEALKYGEVDSIALKVLAMCLANLRFGGLNAEECGAAESELTQLLSSFSSGERDGLLRLKAILDRCRRLADGFCTLILQWFPSRVEKLGRALGVDEHAIRIFAESDIRSHLVFQFSRLVAAILGQVRVKAGLSPWDVIVSGRVRGRLTVVESLDALTGSSREPIVVLMEKAEGDEEIPAGVAGMIVGREVPHLSHLAVRARQSSVVFAVCEDADRFAALKKMQGDWFSLDASPGGVKLEAVGEPGERAVDSGVRGISKETPTISNVIRTFERPLVPLDQATVEAGGGKAFGARRLQELAAMDGAGFLAVPGLVVPFGVMEAALEASPALHVEYRALMGKLNELPPRETGEALDRLRQIIRHLHVVPEITAGATEAFGSDHRLMVRSSTNLEDLDEFAGAGLYESMANVKPSELADGVRRVWASLWTKRAVISRKKMGIPHHKAHMAVLIQPMLIPEYSFILHTVNPTNGDADEVYMELAVGLGETLASAETAGTPYRMITNKRNRKVEVLAYASFSVALLPGPAREELFRATLDYSTMELSINEPFRTRLATRLGAVGVFVERALGRPQDMEGAFLEDKIYLVQSRSQQGLG